MNAPRDRLTIGRLMLLTAGLAVAVAVFRGELEELNGSDWNDTGRWRMVASAILFGLSLPGPLLVFRHRARIGPGGLLWMSLGLGAWLMVPPTLLGDEGGLEGMVWIGTALPLLAFCTTGAAAIGGRFHRRHWGRDSLWCERTGLLLGLLYCPLAIWILVELYRRVIE